MTMLAKTIVRLNAKGISLRATIPPAVVNLLHLKDQDELIYNLEANPGSKKHVRVYLERGEGVN